MTSGQVQQIIDALRTASGGGWNTLVTEQRVIGVQLIAAGGILLLLAMPAVRVAIRGFREWLCLRDSGKRYDWSPAASLAMTRACIAAVVAATGLIAGPIMLLAGLGSLLVPQGAAIQSLLSGL